MLDVDEERGLHGLLHTRLGGAVVEDVHAAAMSAALWDVAAAALQLFL